MEIIKNKDNENNITIKYTEEEHKLLDWARDTLIEKYLAAGGKKSKMMARDEIDAAFCGMLRFEGEQAVKDFVNNYQYKPTCTSCRAYV